MSHWTVRFLPKLPSLSGEWPQSEVGDLIRWQEAVEHDARMRYGCFVVSRGGVDVGLLPLVRCPAGRVPGTLAQAMTALETHSPLAAPSEGSSAFLGPATRLRGGAALQTGLTTPDSTAALTELLRAAILSEETSGCNRLIGPYLPSAQRTAFTSAGFDVQRRADLWSSIDLGRLTSLQALRKARQTLRADLRLIDRSGLRLDWVEVTDDLVRRTAPLVSAVNRRNGAAGHPKLTELEVLRWSRSAPEECSALLCRTSDDELVGIAFIRRLGQVLQVVDCGMVDDSPLRMAAYHAVAFAGPVEYALQRGLDIVELGCSHPYPKRARGAGQDELWHAEMRRTP